MSSDRFAVSILFAMQVSAPFPKLSLGFSCFGGPFPFSFGECRLGFSWARFVFGVYQFRCHKK